MVKVALEAEHDRVRLVVGDPSPSDPLGIARRAEFHVEICPSPLCHCRDVTFVERAGDGSSADRRRQFVLDPFARRPAESDPPEASESERLAHDVAAAMSAESWTRLASMFMNVKARAIAEIDCERERALFPFDEIERDGEMVSYRETIPFDQEILVTDGARELFVDEQHCVRPDCDCTEAILLVHEVDRTPDSDAARTATEVAALRVDHRGGRWVDADTGSPLRAEGTELRRLLLARHPALLATLGRHQALLRDLYRAAAAVAGRRIDAPPPLLAAAPRIGRNDPCPCGSGKKYKKCCLAS